MSLIGDPGDGTLGIIIMVGILGTTIITGDGILGTIGTVTTIGMVGTLGIIRIIGMDSILGTIRITTGMVGMDVIIIIFSIILT